MLPTLEDLGPTMFNSSAPSGGYVYSLLLLPQSFQQSLQFHRCKVRDRILQCLHTRSHPHPTWKRKTMKPYQSRVPLSQRHRVQRSQLRRVECRTFWFVRSSLKGETCSHQQANISLYRSIRLDIEFCIAYDIRCLWCDITAHDHCLWELDSPIQRFRCWGFIFQWVR